MDEEFHIHHGSELSGTLLRTGGSYPDNTRVLRGAYTPAWRPSIQLEGAQGEFRCLAVFITPSPCSLAAARGVTAGCPARRPACA
ncbi:hypothetical protein ACTU45_31400 [Streptomyces sp. 24-1644]|uniref:hypothetical protein n=1 Tax=Streptomyces sp. 24-1644 TaxID=3457315 RepID=UPI003FA72A2E